MGQGRDVLVGGRKRPLLRPHPSLRCRSKPKEAARRLHAGAEVRLGVPVAFKCPSGAVRELGTPSPFTFSFLSPSSRCSPCRVSVARRPRPEGRFNILIAAGAQGGSGWGPGLLLGGKGAALYP